MAEPTKKRGLASSVAERYPSGAFGLAEKLWNSGSPGKAVQALADEMRILDFMVGPMALVLEGPNAAANALRVQRQAAVILKEIESNPDIWSKIESPSVREAVAYVRAKYPRLSSLIGKWTENRGPAGSGASFAPKTAWGEPGSGPPKGKITFETGWGPGTPEAQVEKAGHELTHAVQARKSGDFPGYVPARKQQGWGLEYLDPEQYTRYLAQPYEVQARKGGTTAAETYQRFLSILSGGPK